MSGIFDQVINYAPPSLLKGTVTYKGTWSAATNTPTLVNPPDSTTNGFYYVVSAAGTQFSLVFNINDWIISNGSAWQKVDNTDAVDSVFGRTGAVVGVSTDYSSVGITATAVGASSPSTGAFTTLSATTPLAAASGGTGLSSLGTDVATFLGTPTSANLAAAVTDETGSGSLVFATLPTFGGTGVKLSGSTSGTTTVVSGAAAGTSVLTLPVATDTLVGKATTDTLTNKTLTSPTLTTPALGTPASGTLTSCTGLPLTTGVTGILPAANGGTGVANNAAMTVTGSGNFAYTRTLTAATNVTFPTTGTLATLAGSETLTNKTLTSPTLTAPVLGTPASGTVTNLTGTASININGTVGATTPSTVAGTTISATGTITSTVPADSVISSCTTGTTGFLYHILQNTSGVSIFGLNGSTNTLGGTNSSAYDTVIRGNNISFSANNGTATQARLSSTGLEITGALSASGNLSTISDLRVTDTAGAKYILIGNQNSGGTNTPVILRGVNATLQIGTGTSWSSAGGGTLTTIADFSSTGLAVTGALSATGAISSSAGSSAVPTSANSAFYASASTSNVGYAGTYFDGSTAFSSFLGRVPLSLSGINDGLGYVTIASGTPTLRALFSSTGLAITGTLSATGTVSGAGTGNTQRFNYTTPTTGTGYGYGEWTNTGADMLWGIESSVAGGVFSGSLAYSSVWGTNNATAIHFSPNNVVAMTIVNGGNVGIGTTSPLGKLSVLGSFTARNSETNYEALELSCSAGVANIYSTSGGATGRPVLAFGTNDAERMRISTAGAIKFNNYGAGSLTTDGSGNITAVSDERIKSNIRPFSRGLSDIIAINPILHGYTEESGLDQSRDDYAGFSAQQVQPLIPEAIGVNTDGMLSFSDRPIMAALVNAVKELSARLAALESK